MFRKTWIYLLNDAAKATSTFIGAVALAIPAGPGTHVTWEELGLAIVITGITYFSPRNVNSGLSR